MRCVHGSSVLAASCAFTPNRWQRSTTPICPARLSWTGLSVCWRQWQPATERPPPWTARWWTNLCWSRPNVSWPMQRPRGKYNNLLQYSANRDGGEAFDAVLPLGQTHFLEPEHDGFPYKRRTGRRLSARGHHFGSLSSRFAPQAGRDRRAAEPQHHPGARSVEDARGGRLYHPRFV